MVVDDLRLILELRWRRGSKGRLSCPCRCPWLLAVSGDLPMFFALLVTCVPILVLVRVVQSLEKVKGKRPYRSICASRSWILSALETFLGLGLLTSVTGAVSSYQGVSQLRASVPCIRSISTLLNQSDISDRVEKSLSSSSCMTRAMAKALANCRYA